MSVAQTYVEGLWLLLQPTHFFGNSTELALKTINNIINLAQDLIGPFQLIVKDGNLISTSHVVWKTLTLKFGELLFNFQCVATNIKFTFTGHKIWQEFEVLNFIH